MAYTLVDALHEVCVSIEGVNRAIEELVAKRNEVLAVGERQRLGLALAEARGQRMGLRWARQSLERVMMDCEPSDEVLKQEHFAEMLEHVWDHPSRVPGYGVIGD